MTYYSLHACMINAGSVQIRMPNTVPVEAGNLCIVDSISLVNLLLNDQSVSKMLKKAQQTIAMPTIAN